MLVHHLDCGSMRTIAPLQPNLPELRVVCHCLLVETTDGLVLVDTGLGLGDISRPAESLGVDFLGFAEPVLDPAQTAVRQVRALGFQPDDVRHIVLTHLHRDHTGGLPDFPAATVHLHHEEYRAVTDPAAAHHAVSLARFMTAHREHEIRWSPTRPEVSIPWFGVRAFPLAGLPAEILLVPLVGHTPGHSAVAVRTGDRWLLHAGDSYLYHGELDDPPHEHPDVQPIQLGAQVDARLRHTGLDWLRRLRLDLHAQVEVFCSHDPWEYARLASGRDELPPDLAVPRSGSPCVPR